MKKQHLLKTVSGSGYSIAWCGVSGPATSFVTKWTATHPNLTPADRFCKNCLAVVARREKK